jgi:hypothetical protein
MIKTDRAGQVPHGLAGGLTKSRAAHHVNHFLPAELHGDH